MNTPGIRIIGPVASGKSALAFAIKTALEALGIQVVIPGDEDESHGVMEQVWKDRIACLKGRVVAVETSQSKASVEHVPSMNQNQNSENP